MREDDAFIFTQKMQSARSQTKALSPMPMQTTQIIVLFFQGLLAW
jgi:hypothetical protein